MTNVTIQLASKKNLAEVIPFVRAYHEFENLELTEIEREQSVGKLLSDNSLGGLLLIYVDKERVGYIVLCLGYSIEFAGLDAFVDEFYIQPESRGKGTGTKVLELIKEEAKKMNVRAIHLEVARTNQHAKNLYSKANFKAREKYVIMSVDL
jgi:ribosomal protein S18 acetylase RimI-like enzyme